MGMEGLKGIHTITQAAALLGLTEGGLRKLISYGTIATVTLPGMQRPKLITQAEVERYLRERKPRGRPSGARDSRPRKRAPKPEGPVTP